MQNRYTGDIGDFGKFLLLKYLFPEQSIATVWYLYPDETHNNDGSHRVVKTNLTLYHSCHAIDSHMAQAFNTIHEKGKRHVDRFSEASVLKNSHYFTQSILGEGENYRLQWLTRATEFIRSKSCSVVCLDPDNGIEPQSFSKFSPIKQGKYATYTEIEAFFTSECVEHLIIYQHFHRQQSHDVQMREVMMRFEKLYKGRGEVTIIRHNPVQARFYIVLSKPPKVLVSIQSLENHKYGSRAFFSALRAMND